MSLGRFVFLGENSSHTDALDVIPSKLTPDSDRWRLILLEAPGVGKGTQAQFLEQRMRECHLSTRDDFRAARSRGECVQSPAMGAAVEAMRGGELICDEIIWALLGSGARSSIA